MTKPITPADIGPAKAKVLPDFVIDVWNDVIAKRADGRKTIHIRQGDVVSALLPFVPDGRGRDHIFAEGWLDVEPMYEAAGWAVSYSKPAYNESGEACFTFKPKTRNKGPS